MLSLAIDFHFELNRLLISISIKLIKRYTEFDNTQECIFNFFYFSHKEYKQLCLMMKNLSICSWRSRYFRYLINGNLFNKICKNIPSIFNILNMSCTARYLGSFLKAWAHICISSNILLLTLSFVVV